MRSFRCALRATLHLVEHVLVIPACDMTVFASCALTPNVQCWGPIGMNDILPKDQYEGWIYPGAFARCHGRIGFQNNDGVDCFTPLLARDFNHSAQGDGGMPGQRVLHFG